MNLTDEELQRERGEHQLVADAMASVRLFHTLFGDGEQTREWVRELVRVMYQDRLRPGMASGNPCSPPRPTPSPGPISGTPRGNWNGRRPVADGRHDGRQSG